MQFTSDRMGLPTAPETQCTLTSLLRHVDLIRAESLLTPLLCAGQELQKILDKTKIMIVNELAPPTSYYKAVGFSHDGESKDVVSAMNNTGDTEVGE